MNPLNNDSKAAEYRKLIAALVGAIALLLSSSGVVVDEPILDFAITVLTGFAVWRAPNVPPTGQPEALARGRKKLP